MAELIDTDKLEITLEEMKELKERAKETMDGPFGKMPTPEAEKASTILKNANIKVTLKEYKRLEELAKEKEENKLFKGEYNYTDKALEIQKILNSGKIIIEESKEQENIKKLFSTDDIGKGTLPEQKDTGAKEWQEAKEGKLKKAKAKEGELKKAKAKEEK